MVIIVKSPTGVFVPVMVGIGSVYFRHA